MAALDDFKRFVVDAESGAQYATWAHDNPVDLGRWQAFRDLILGGSRPSPPTMTTPHGRELVDAGVLFLDTAVTTPPPPPPPATGQDGRSLPAHIPFLDPAATYHVNGVTGDDSRSMSAATNQATPWKSLQHALDAIPIPTTGDHHPQEIVLHGDGCTITDDGPGSTCPPAWRQTNSAGTWQPSRRLSFPDDSPLTVTVSEGERALLPVRFFFGHGDSNIRFYAQPVGGKRGLVCDPRFPGGATVGGISFVGARNVELWGVEVRNSGWAGGSGGGAYFGAHSTYGPTINPVVRGCKIHHNGGALKGFHGIYWGGTTSGQEVGVRGGAIINSIIAWNTDDNLCPHNCAVGSVIANCLLLGYGGGGAGSAIASAPLTDAGASYAWSDGITLFAAPSGQQTSDLVVVNSILAHNKAYGLNQYDSASGGGNVEHHNLFFANGAGDRHDSSGGGWKFLSTLLGHDPLFVRYQAGDPTSDFHLQHGSPATAAADPNYLAFDDYDFAARTAADVGPYAVA